MTCPSSQADAFNGSQKLKVADTQNQDSSYTLRSHSRDPNAKAEGYASGRSFLNQRESDTSLEAMPSVTQTVLVIEEGSSDSRWSFRSKESVEYKGIVVP